MQTPQSIVEHQPRFKADAWKDYSITELGSTVAFFVKRASHRTEPAKAAKDLTDAQNYLDMLQAHVTDAKAQHASV